MEQLQDTEEEEEDKKGIKYIQKGICMIFIKIS
jgi:hypothetical protein